jgi:hypothetical protein
MTAQLPENRGHVAHLLPAYMNGKLDSAAAGPVRAHLLHCDACQRELSSWEAIRDVARSAVASNPQPSTHVMSQVWAKIDGVEQKAAAHQRPFRRSFAILWLLLRKQIPLIHKSIWIASALVCVLGCVLAFLMTPRTPQEVQNVEALLTLFITVAAATGAAFIYGANVDPAFELTIATPTSIRLVMLFRMLLVLGYNFILAALASTIFSLAHGNGLWSFMQLWLGPMLLLSSFSLTVSLVLGSTFAVMGTILLEAMQTFPSRVIEGITGLRLAGFGAWQTTPTIVLLAVLLTAFAIFYVPRQPRLSA